MKKTYILLLALLLPVLHVSAQKSIESRIDSLISTMSVEEKAGQLNQLDGRTDIEKLKRIVRSGRIGSIMNIVDVKTINELQRIAVNESPRHIPLLFARDIVHGFKTVLPIPLGQASSFDDALMEKCSRNTAAEATECGIRWAFAPMMDIARDARWGRIAEGFGEDQYLAGRLAASVVKGYQGSSLSDKRSMAACAKHFVGYGATEGGRDYNTTYIPQRQLLDVYLRPFKVAVDSGCASIMSSFNDNNGIPSTGNRWLLTELLRKQWGFDGVVVSDWGSVAGLIPHGIAADRRDAAQQCIKAGCDMDMSSMSYVDNMKALVESGEVTMECLNEAVRRVMRLKFRLGLFDAPYTETPKKSVIYSEKHIGDARCLASESVVLLKNGGVLPLSGKMRSILVTGPMADAPYDQMGTWTLDGDKTHTVTPLSALRSLYGKKVKIDYVPCLTHPRDTSSASISSLGSLDKYDAVIAFVGEEQMMSGEAHSLSSLNLQGRQTELLEKLAKGGAPLVTVFMAGRPLTISRECDLSDAVLYAWHPGTAGGYAIADILFGKVNPSAKTPVTFPRNVGQIPIYYNHKHTSHIAKGNEGDLSRIPREAQQSVMGHTSSYLDVAPTPLFPFGYGLSYTTFDISALEVENGSLSLNDTLNVAVTLRNTGKVEGTETVQLYTGRKTASVTQPMKELKDYRRVSLRPGEEKKVIFQVPVDRLRYHDRELNDVVEPGEYSVMVGNSSENLITGKFSVR